MTCVVSELVSFRGENKFELQPKNEQIKDQRRHFYIGVSPGFLHRTILAACQQQYMPSKELLVI